LRAAEVLFNKVSDLLLKKLNSNMNKFDNII